MESDVRCWCAPRHGPRCLSRDRRPAQARVPASRARSANRIAPAKRSSRREQPGGRRKESAAAGSAPRRRHRWICAKRASPAQSLRLRQYGLPAPIRPQAPQARIAPAHSRIPRNAAHDRARPSNSGWRHGLGQPVDRLWHRFCVRRVPWRVVAHRDREEAFPLLWQTGNSLKMGWQGGTAQGPRFSVSM